MKDFRYLTFTSKLFNNAILIHAARHSLSLKFYQLPSVIKSNSTIERCNLGRSPDSNVCASLRASPPLHSTALPKTRLEGRFGVARFSKTWAHLLISIECECCSQGGRKKRVSHSRASKSVETVRENDVSFRNNGLLSYSYHRTPSIVLCFVFKQVGYLKIEERSRV